MYGLEAENSEPSKPSDSGPELSKPKKTQDESQRIASKGYSHHLQYLNFKKSAPKDLSPPWVDQKYMDINDINMI